MSKKILLIEDEKEVAELMIDILSSEKFEPTWVDDGRKGVVKAKELMPDLIILDLMLHDMHGLTVCKAIKADEATKHIPVIIYSGRMEPGVTDDVLKAGGSLFMSKLTPPSKIIQIIKDFIRDSGI